MTYYLALAFVLSVAAVVATLRPRWSLPIGISTAVALSIFAGIRFETGFDWPVYTQVFDNTRTIGEVTSGVAVSEDSVTTEPLYKALNSLLKTFGASDVQVLFLLVATFNMAAITYAAWRISRTSIVLVWTVYFGFTFLPAQMALERQSIASSFVLFGLLLFQRPLLASALILVGAGFQYSVIVFLPIIYLSRFHPNAIWSTGVVMLGLLVLIFRIDLFSPIATTLLLFGHEPLARKLVYYIDSGAAPLTFATIGATAMMIGILLALHFLPREDERRDRFIRIALWLTLLQLISLLYFNTMPTIWTRVILVSLPWQVAALYRLRFWRELAPVRKALLVAVAGVVSAGVLFSYIRKPSTIVFRPYNSIVHVWLTGNRGDGVERSKQMIRLFEEENPRVPRVNIIYPPK